jgi:hypothetical protein
MIEMTCASEWRRQRTRLRDVWWSCHVPPECHLGSQSARRIPEEPGTGDDRDPPLTPTLLTVTDTCIVSLPSQYSMHNARPI